MDEFLVDRETEQITDLVPCEEYLWMQRDVLIPVSRIGQIEEERIYRPLTKAKVADLSAFPVRRWQVGLGEE